MEERVATELHELGRRLRDHGYPEAGAIVATLARSLHTVHLIPAGLPHLTERDHSLTAYRSGSVAIDLDRLHRRRMELHLSKRGLALAARLSPSYICNLENGLRACRVRWSTVVALAHALDLSPESLLAQGESEP